MNFYGLSFYSYYYSAVVDVVAMDAVATTDVAAKSKKNHFLLKEVDFMPENRGCGCGFGFGDDCIWIILILILICCCCGGGRGGCC